MDGKNVALATLKNNTDFSYSLILQPTVYCARCLPATGLLFLCILSHRLRLGQ
jgi:hypothetical protein